MTDPANYREHSYRSADGRLNLFAREYLASQEEMHQLPLLMMHGLTRNSADFEPLIGQLGVGSRRMIVPDQRGRGLSEHDPDSARYRPDVYVADMWQLLDELAIDQVVCIGTSMGGLISMLMGVQSPKRISGIVLNDVGPEVSQEGLERIRDYVGQAEPMAGWDEAAARCKTINASAMDGFGPDEWMMFARRTCQELPDGRVCFAYDPAISDGLAPQHQATIPQDLWTLWRALSNIPVLALRGANSDILTRETVARMADDRAANFVSVEIPGRGHAPILDEPAAVEAIRKFVATYG